MKYINEPFICINCGVNNSKGLHGLPRNHCYNCLFSMHLDMIPGDRNSSCNGIMNPIKIEIKNAEMRRILFKCVVCNDEHWNIIADDDNRNAVLDVFYASQKQEFKALENEIMTIQRLLQKQKIAKKKK